MYSYVEFEVFDLNVGSENTFQVLSCLKKKRETE